jgi:hypothetical protein
MKRFLFYLIVIPIAVLVLIFAVANRHLVVVSLDPLGARAPGLTVEIPLFLLMFLLLAIGVVLGGIAAWFGQAKHRRAARLARYEADRHRAEAERVRAELAGVETVRRPSLPAPVPF